MIIWFALGHALRGGGWIIFSRGARVAYHSNSTSGDGYNDLGVRLMRRCT